MHMIGGSVDDQRRAVHFTNNSTEVGKQIIAEFRLNQRMPSVRAENQMQYDVAGRMQYASFAPLGLLLNLLLAHGLRRGLHACAASRLRPASHLASIPSLGAVTNITSIPQQLPGLAVLFVAVTVLAQGDHGAEHGSGFAHAAEQDDGRDDVPGVLRNDVGGEEVDLLDGVVPLLVIVGLELAEVSGASAVGGGFDLYAQDAAAGFDPDVIRRGITPGFGDLIAMPHGLSHKAEFDPFAPFFQGREELALIHICLVIGQIWLSKI